MGIDDDIAVLERVPMLRALGRGALRLIALGAEVRDVPAGEVLFKPGEKVDGAYVVQDGRFQLTADPAQPGKLIEVGPGAILGEFSLIAENVKPLCAIAQGECTVIRISRSMFLKILLDDANAALRLRDYVEHRVQQSVADVLQVRGALGQEDQG